MNWEQRIDEALKDRQSQGLMRQRAAVSAGAGRWLESESGRWRNFAGNDYLGLARHPKVIAAWQAGAARYGTGSGGSGHVVGYSEAHRRLEQALAEWAGYPRALLFISGYAANQAVITALAGAKDALVADRLSHASLLEAANLAPGRLRRFLHNDIESLKRQLSRGCSGLQMVVTEGIFSMDGDSAPLAEIARIADETGALLLVDDAHGAGAVGDAGRGSCAMQHIRPDILVITFGKAFGVSGAAVLCSTRLGDYFLQFARHLIYSTAMPPAQAEAISAALAIVRSDEGNTLRALLQARIEHFRAGAAPLAWRLSPSVSAIQPLIVGDNHRTLALSDALRKKGVWTVPIRPPTVQSGSARLRITLSAAHTPADINMLLEALHACSR